MMDIKYERISKSKESVDMAVMRDVAKRAGVSTGTVSNFFSNPEGLKIETRKRVALAVRELNYHPSSLARSLRTQMTKLLAMIVPDIVNPFYASLYDAIRFYAAQYGYKPILYTTEDDLEILKGYLEEDYIHEVDGIVLCFLDEDEIISDFQQIQSRLPIVLLSWDIHANTDSVVIDVFEAIRTATCHLLDLGHHDIAYIGGPPDSRISKEKKKGYERAMTDAGCVMTPEYLYEGRYRFETGYKAAHRFLRLSKPPTAIVAANDALAIGCIKHILQQGIQIPEDIAVIGLDNIPLATMYQPSLSTVSIPIRNLGEQGIKILMERIKRPRGRRHQVLLKTELIIRSSTYGNASIIVEW
jgi:DNA-binding LacI/PurR family transcriptional regulator